VLELDLSLANIQKILALEPIKPKLVIESKIMAKEYSKVFLKLFSKYEKDISFTLKILMNFRYAVFETYQET